VRPVAPLVVLLAASPALASTAVEMDVSALAAASTDVVRGRVLASTPTWTADHRRIVTRVTLEVLEAWKGPGARQITVVQPGGELDGIGQRVAGVARLGPGEEVVLFLERAGPHHRVVGLAQGVYRVTADGASGGMHAVPASLEGLHLVPPANQTPGLRGPLPLSELRKAVQAAR
jgi:hypothetical protein